MKTKKESDAYQFLMLIWKNEQTDSYRKLNRAMAMAVETAITANLQFAENDFDSICSNMRGGYWFGCNSNGKGIGENFYSDAIGFNNISAIKSYENWEGLKPFILKKGGRVHCGSRFGDKKNRYKVTGFDFETGKIHIVSYLIKDCEEKGKRKLHAFTNKEWLKFRKDITINKWN